MNFYSGAEGNSMSLIDTLGLARQGGETGQWWEDEVSTDRSFQRWFHLCLNQLGDSEASGVDWADAYAQWVQSGKPNLADSPREYGGALIQEKKDATHVYTVGLRFSGDPAEISARLNLQPSHVSSQFQTPSTTRKISLFFGYNGREDVGFQYEWESLEDGLDFLLKSLSSKKAEIMALSRQFNGYWWCGHFQTGFSGGPSLSPRLLAEAGSYDIPLSIDHYFSDEEEDPDSNE